MAPLRDPSTGRFTSSSPSPEGEGSNRTTARASASASGGAPRLVRRSAGDVWDGASDGRRLHGWRPKRTGPQSHWTSGNASLVARSRDASRNNPHARRVIDVLVSALVGPGLTPQWESRDEGANVILADAFKRWMKPRFCDRGGRLSFGALQQVAIRAEKESGGVFLRRHWVTGQEVPLQIETFEVDLLDLQKSSTSNPRIMYGIELDESNRAVAYWLHPSHPGDNSIISMSQSSSQSVRVPATDLIYYYRTERPGALGGVPALAPVLARLRQIDDYDVATLTRQQIAATITAFISPAIGEMEEDPASTGDGAIGRHDGYRDGCATDAFGDPVETMENGLLVYLDGGRKVEISNPPVPVDAEWRHGQLRDTAVGAGVTMMQLSGDLREANYSSMRAGLIDFRGMIDAEREAWLIPGLLDQMAEWWVEAAYVGGVTRERYTPCSWAARAWASVDPSKDMKAMIDALAAGLASQPDLLQQLGYDPDQWIRDMVAWMKKLKDAGIELPAAKASSSGTPADQAEPANPPA